MTDTETTETLTDQERAEQLLAAAVASHTASAARFAEFASALADLYTITAGMALCPVVSWHIRDSTYGSHATGRLRETYGEPARNRREALTAWALALGVEITEKQGYGSETDLSVSFLVGSVRLKVHTLVEHECSCTGQCAEVGTGVVG